MAFIGLIIANKHFMLKEMKSDNPIVAPDCPVVVGGSPIEHLSICEIECDHTRQRSRNYLDLLLIL